jgi:hypothetical protein
MDALSDLRIPHLSNGLDVTEGSSTGTLGDKPDGLVDTAHGRHVDSLATDHTTSTNAGGVLTGGRVDDGVNKLLDGVAVGEKVDDVESVLDDADGHDLLAVVAAVHHERAGEALNDRALGLLEALLLEAAGSVGHELRELRLDGDVVLEGDVSHGDIIVAPLVEELDLASIALRRHDDKDPWKRALALTSESCFFFDPDWNWFN